MAFDVTRLRLPIYLNFKFLYSTPIISFKCSIPREPHSSYSRLLAMIDLGTLEQCWLDLYFSFEIFVGNINCPVFLSYFSIHALLVLPVLKIHFIWTLVTNYTDVTPINRIMKTLNELINIELFISLSFHLFKTYCKCILNNS